MEKKLVSFVASALLVSSAMAAPNIATDGTGDYLIAPMYSFDNQWATKLVLMNTDNEHAYIIRGVIRSNTDSKEVGDFTILLSPGDVWDAKIDDNMIVSNDDSNWNGTLQELLNGATTGYIEFFILAEFDNNNPAVNNVLKRSNYSADYKKHSVDVMSIDKQALKELAIRALGGENVNNGDPAAADTSLVLHPSQINQDAIGGYVTIYSVTNDTFSTTLPLFAFEKARASTNKNVNGEGFLPGGRTISENYINPDEVLPLIQYDYISIPYNFENDGEAKVNLTFILDEDHNDLRTFKQTFRNKSEKYPEEKQQCLEGNDLLTYVLDKYEDAKDPSVSPFFEPDCNITIIPKTPKIYHEVDGVMVQKLMLEEANLTYTRKIKYWTKNDEYVVKEENLSLNDLPHNKEDLISSYSQGMYQIHEIRNVYPASYVGFKPGYIPTYFDIRKIGNQKFINWNYAIRKK